MLQSHVIDIDGVFVGAAIRLDTGYRFIATDMRLEELDATTWPSLADVHRLARRLITSSTLADPARSEVARSDIARSDIARSDIARSDIARSDAR